MARVEKGDLERAVRAPGVVVPIDIRYIAARVEGAGQARATALDVDLDLARVDPHGSLDDILPDFPLDDRPVAGEATEVIVARLAVVWAKLPHRDEVRTVG